MKFHRAIAAAFYSAGIPFRVIENPAVRYILTCYRPGMPLPTRQELAAKLLDEEYAEEWENVKVVLQGEKIVAVVCDRWSNPNSEGIVNFMVVSPFIRPIFWCSVRTRDDRHTGESMAAALTRVISEVESIVGKGSVSAAVTDNAPNMCKPWELLTERSPTITCNGCAAHTLNLVLKDMFAIPYLADILKSAVAVTKFVRKRPALLYNFREVQRQKLGSRQRRRALVLPVSTRWYSSTNCISSIVRNEEVLREVFANETLLDRYKAAAVKLERAKTILADSSFWMKARAVMRLTEPVVKALGSLEKDGCCLSMVYHYFRELRHHRVFKTQTDDVDGRILTRIQTIIAKRWKSMKRESVLAAYLLDPSKSPDGFDADDLDKAVNACISLAMRIGLRPGVTEESLWDTVMKFIRTKDGWSSEQWEQASSITPLDWWRLRSSNIPTTREFASRMLSIPTSSAASERSWSIHSFIHSKRRNRLKPARVEKLAFLYTNVGDKTATSQVHYKPVADAGNSAEDTNSSTDFSDIESPRETSIQRIGASRGYSVGGNVAARRPLLGHTQAEPDPHFQPVQLSSSGQWMVAHESHQGRLTPAQSANRRQTTRTHTEFPLTQSAPTGSVFTRADEYQLLPDERESASAPTASGYITPLLGRAAFE